MADIKTRDVVKGTIKTIDRSAIASQRMKQAYIRTKKQAVETAHAPQRTSEGTPEAYATDRVSDRASVAAHEAAHQAGKMGDKAITGAREHFQRKRQENKLKKETSQRRQAAASAPPADTPTVPGTPGTVPGATSTTPPASPAQAAAPTTAHTAPATSARYSAPAPGRSFRGRPAPRGSPRYARSIGESARYHQKASQRTVKTAREAAQATQRTIKTAERSGKMAIKTSEQAAKITQRSAQTAAKTAQATARAAQTAAKAAAASFKAVTKAMISSVKAIIAATQALVTALTAGGAVAFLVIMIICLIGLLVGSVFGIFFSGEDAGTGLTMRTAIREINRDYQDKIDGIKNSITHDELEMSGSRATWPEVLAVYSVKTNTDPTDPDEVASMTKKKKSILEDIFWQMNAVSYDTRTDTRTETTTTTDEDGNIVETQTTISTVYLYITVTHKTPEEMADYYHFNAKQRKQLDELLSDEYRALWNTVLYGIGIGDGDIVAVALSQVGNVGGQPYWSWYGFTSRVEWCACFVSWCAEQCGYIENGIIPKFAGCPTGVQWFRDRGLWADRNYEPNPGDIIFFDWASDGLDGSADHVAIVEKCEGGIVYTVEGNSGDACKQKQYSVGYYQILGYGVPAY